MEPRQQAGSPDSQHGRHNRHPANVGCSFFRYETYDLRSHTNQRGKHKKWTREHNQIALHYYLRSNPTRRGYRKRMIEIWHESSSFQTINQRIADKVRTIINFYLLRTFFLILVVFFFFFFFFWFLLSIRFGQISPLAFFRWFTATSDRNAESCNRIPSNYCLP